MERGTVRHNSSGARTGGRAWIERHPVAVWLACLLLVCVLEVATHAGGQSGFLVSSRPEYSGNDRLPGDGYVSWAGDVPVLHDSDGFFTLVALFLGRHAPGATGILDRRAAYAYLASLTVPWMGAYDGFLLVNVLFWWGAAAAAFWFVRRRWEDTTLALATSFLVAVGHGFLFMADVPMSYAAAYASVMLLIALGEWLGAFRRDVSLRSWLVLGWGAGVASTLYFAHIPLLIFWWIYGLRRVPWRHLAAATAVTLVISLGWEWFGRNVVGMDFLTDNSSIAGDAVRLWLAHVFLPWPVVLIYFRGGALAGAAALRGTLLSAFPYPWWALAAVGFATSRRADREWALAIVLGGLVPSLVILSLLPLPRVAYYMYPAVYVMAARGAITLGRLCAAALRATIKPAAERPERLAFAVALAAALAGLALTSNADLLGYQQLNARFHLSMVEGW